VARTLAYDSLENKHARHGARKQYRSQRKCSTDQSLARKISDGLPWTAGVLAGGFCAIS
jgi:hypothetical protein